MPVKRASLLIDEGGSDKETSESGTEEEESEADVPWMLLFLR